MGISPQWPLECPPKLGFIAEAPSDVEMEEGKPLVGPSGRIFNSILKTANISREEHLVTNVFNEKLPDNDVGNWCVNLSDARRMGWTGLPPIGKSGFLRPEYHHHLVRLREEIERCRPTVIVPLGGTALWAFTGAAGIGSVRGTVLAATHTVPGMKLLPTYHPTAVMHQFKFYSVVVGDIEKALVESENGPSIHLPQRELLLAPTLQEIREYLPRLLTSNLLSVDIETAWGDITCIGFAPDPEHAICIPFVDRRKPSFSYWDDPRDEQEAWKLVREVCESDVPKVGQNGGTYDFFWLLEKRHIGLRNYREDTRLMHHALFPELPKSLEFMQSYGTQGAWKSMGRHKDKRDA